MRCARKLAFDTVEAAERTAAVVVSLRGNGGKVPVRIYECHRCGHLHFSSKTEAEVRSASTVADLFVAQLFVVRPEPVPEPPTVIDPCAGCGKGGAHYELKGAFYHRRCRWGVFRRLPSAERNAINTAWSLAGNARHEAEIAVRAGPGGNGGGG